MCIVIIEHPTRLTHGPTYAPPDACPRAIMAEDMKKNKRVEAGKTRKKVRALETQWAEVGTAHAALLKKYELRVYQLNNATTELKDVKERLDMYEPSNPTNYDEFLSDEDEVDGEESEQGQETGGSLGERGEDDNGSTDTTGNASAGSKTAKSGSNGSSGKVKPTRTRVFVKH